MLPTLPSCPYIVLSRIGFSTFDGINMFRTRGVKIGAGILGGFITGYQGMRFCSAAGGNPQAFTGYWKGEDGTMLRLKQWGDRVTGSLGGKVEGERCGDMVLQEGNESAVIDGKKFVRCQPELVVVCGPSGVGKGTLLAKLFKEFPDSFGFSVSHTTRGPRPGEVDGKDYFFTTNEEIEKMIADNQFVEYANVHGNYYGTSKAAVEAVQKQGKICVLDIDVQGAQKVAVAGIPFVGIFVKPPSAEELERRLRGRGTETEEKILKRLSNSLKEIAFCDTHEFFWYELTNNSLDTCYSELVAAISQSTKSPALPKVPHTINSTPTCGVFPASQA
eukprot:TRINITY_DN4614_c0_g1_i2.p2 TRINITY_DN4614_c0_g1~~TRINITY_DN4614_c0_g1_i2.p2  ORF type:complete len:332 (+),score=107.56 TRINITY_DN4614_c0_g1_i2:2183-3178(+)